MVPNITTTDKNNVVVKIQAVKMFPCVSPDGSIIVQIVLLQHRTG